MKLDAPLYKLKVNYEDESGVYTNSFVKSPAVKYHKYNFAEEDKFIFTKEDAVKQRFFGVSILADVPIERVNRFTREKYYVMFDAETIEIISNKMAMEGKLNEVNYNHQEQAVIEGVYLVEQFILEKGRVESPLFKDVPDGSLLQTYYIHDKEMYEGLAADTNFNGFSVEVTAKMEEFVFAEFDELNLEERIKEITFSENLSDEEKEKQIKNLLSIK